LQVKKTEEVSISNYHRLISKPGIVEIKELPSINLEHKNGLKH
jgi:hypothetical protein